MTATGGARSATRTRTRRTCATLAALAATAAVTLAGCATGQQAQTSNEVSSEDTVQGKVGDIQLQSVAFRAPSSSSYPAGASVPLVAYFVNNGRSADSLTDVSSTSFKSWQITSAAASGATPAASGSPSASLAPASGTGFGLTGLTPQGGESERVIMMRGLTKRLYPGSTLMLTFTFAQAGQTTLAVPVQLSTQPNTQTLPGSASPAGD